MSTYSYIIPVCLTLLYFTLSSFAGVWCALHVGGTPASVIRTQGNPPPQRVIGNVDGLGPSGDVMVAFVHHTAADITLQSCRPTPTSACPSALGDSASQKTFARRPRRVLVPIPPLASLGSRLLGSGIEGGASVEQTSHRTIGIDCSIKSTKQSRSSSSSSSSSQAPSILHDDLNVAVGAGGVSVGTGVGAGLQVGVAAHEMGVGVASQKHQPSMRMMLREKKQVSVGLLDRPREEDGEMRVGGAVTADDPSDATASSASASASSVDGRDGDGGGGDRIVPILQKRFVNQVSTLGRDQKGRDRGHRRRRGRAVLDLIASVELEGSPPFNLFM